MIDLKEKISLSEGVPIPEQQLVYVQDELQNKTAIKETGIEEGSTIHLVLIAPTAGPQQTSYFTSCSNPSLSVARFRLGLGLEQLLPVGRLSPCLRPPRLPLPPHTCHIVHMYDIPYPAWEVFVQYLYSRHLSRGACHVFQHNYDTFNYTLT